MLLRESQVGRSVSAVGAAVRLDTKVAERSDAQSKCIPGAPAVRQRGRLLHHPHAVTAPNESAVEVGIPAREILDSREHAAVANHVELRNADGESTVLRDVADRFMLDG